jgi:hypothetical protein
MHYQTGPGTRRSWPATVEHLPDANLKATVTIPRGGPGVRNVCTGLTVTLVAGAVAPAAVTVKAHLIDGPSGGSTYLWSTRLGLPAIAGSTSGVARAGRWVGTEDTSMTLEFEIAGGANVFESVAMEGHTELG